VSDFKNLKVWRKAHALALNVHRVVTQIRAADSAALRIANKSDDLSPEDAE
jgi:tRNA threonylcarbamoyladenosine modification (KEOPS) complex  Pcc1 subunit